MAISFFRKTNDPSSPIPGSQSSAKLSAYSIGDLIGQGRIGKVYSATVANRKVDVAVKIVDTSTGSGPDYKRLFFQHEVALLEKISHPRIVNTYEVFQNGSKIYFVMEMVTGGSLLRHINSLRFLPEDEAVRIFKEIGEAVRYCHGLGYIHRDLKCENILLDSDKRVKLADFSFATSCREGQKLKQGCGSPNYSCPEILERLPYDGQKADVWSLGVILYCMVCGRLPFTDKSVEVLKRQVRDKIVFPKRVPHTCRVYIRGILNVEQSQRPSLIAVLSHPYIASFGSS